MANILSIILTQLQCVKKEIEKEGGVGGITGRRHICSTHLSAKRYNYLSQHIIHVLYQPRALCLCLATLTPCKAHILTLAMTVYLRKGNCPLGDGEGERDSRVEGKWEGKREGQRRWRGRGFVCVRVCWDRRGKRKNKDKIFLEKKLQRKMLEEKRDVCTVINKTRKTRQG